MKYNSKITLTILSLFLFSQLIGLFVTNYYLENKLPFSIERPELAPQTSFIPIIITIIIVTLIAILLIRFKAEKIWKIWFFLGISIALLISFSAFVPKELALILALVLAGFKIFKPNIIIHNLGELFIYGGMAALFVPIFSIVSIIMLLIIISIYDFIAVFKTKHMIKIAKFQARMKVFAGLVVPYNDVRIEKGKTRKVVRSAILGGGDLGFPLLFAGVVLNEYNLIASLMIVLFSCISLLILLYLAKKNKFYPAMPFITSGCLIGYGLSLLL